MIWMAISMVVNGNLFVYERDIGYIVVFYIRISLIYYFLICSLSTPGRLKYFIAILVLIAIILSVEGIQHKISGVGWAGQKLGWVDPEVIATGGTGRTKWVGIFDGPGVFCVIYTVALPFLLVAVKQTFPFTVRILSYISIPLILIAIYLTGSRGGLITTLAIFLLYSGWNIKKSKFPLIVGAGIIAALVLIAPSHMTEIHDSSKSTYHRIEMWSEGLEMVTQNPIFGIGRGNFASYTSKLIAHSSPIEIMGETGMVGFFAWLGLLYMSLKNILLYMRQESSSSNELLAKGLFIAIAGYVVSSMFVTLEYETYYILLALGGVLGRNLKEPNRLTIRDITMIGFACVSWAAVVYVYARWYGSQHF
jgi:O-antigen ligase